MFPILFLLWVIFNGKITLEICLFGIVICAAICFFCAQATGYTLAWEKRLIRLFSDLTRYFFRLVKDVVVANYQVARLILSGREPDPVLVQFEPGFERTSSTVLLANSITLTPGTITARLEHGELTVHCLTHEMAQGLEDSPSEQHIAKMEEKQL